MKKICNLKKFASLSISLSSILLSACNGGSANSSNTNTSTATTPNSHLQSANPNGTNINWINQNSNGPGGIYALAPEYKMESDGVTLDYALYTDNTHLFLYDKTKGGWQSNLATPPNITGNINHLAAGYSSSGQFTSAVITTDHGEVYYYNSVSNTWSELKGEGWGQGINFLNAAFDKNGILVNAVVGLYNNPNYYDSNGYHYSATGGIEYLSLSGVRELHGTDWNSNVNQIGVNRDNDGNVTNIVVGLQDGAVENWTGNVDTCQDNDPNCWHELHNEGWRSGIAVMKTIFNSSSGAGTRVLVGLENGAVEFYSSSNTGNNNGGWTELQNPGWRSQVNTITLADNWESQVGNNYSGSFVVGLLNGAVEYFNADRGGFTEIHDAGWSSHVDSLTGSWNGNQLINLIVGLHNGAIEEYYAPFANSNDNATIELKNPTNQIPGFIITTFDKFGTINSINNIRGDGTWYQYRNWDADQALPSDSSVPLSYQNFVSMLSDLLLQDVESGNCSQYTNVNTGSDICADLNGASIIIPATESPVAVIESSYMVLNTYSSSNSSQSLEGYTTTCENTTNATQTCTTPSINTTYTTTNTTTLTHGWSTSIANAWAYKFTAGISFFAAAEFTDTFTFTAGYNGSYSTAKQDSISQSIIDSAQNISVAANTSVTAQTMVNTVNPKGISTIYQPITVNTNGNMYYGIWVYKPSNSYSSQWSYVRASRNLNNELQSLKSNNPYSQYLDYNESDLSVDLISQANYNANIYLNSTIVITKTKL